MWKTSDHDKIDIVTKYISGKNCTEIAKDYDITPTAVNGILKRRDIPRRPQSMAQRKYNLNVNFFDQIDTQEKAYFLGILYADGYNDTNRNAVNLQLIEPDKEILEKLTNLIQPSKPLQYIKIKNERHNNCFRLVIANKHISQQLVILGCTNNKTFTLKFPTFLSPNLFPHFIRGYYDGDGSLNVKTNNSCVNIVSTLPFCRSLSNIFHEVLHINSYIRKCHKGRNTTTRMIETAGNLQVLSFLDWIYANSRLHLSRKYQKYLTLIKTHDDLLRLTY